MFVGDNGQGDVRAAEMMVERYPGKLEAVYVHRVRHIMIISPSDVKHLVIRSFSHSCALKEELDADCVQPHGGIESSRKRWRMQGRCRRRTQHTFLCPLFCRRQRTQTHPPKRDFVSNFCSVRVYLCSSLILSYLVLSCLVLSCRVVSCHVLSVLSYLVVCLVRLCRRRRRLATGER